MQTSRQVLGTTLIAAALLSGALMTAALADPQGMSVPAAEPSTASAPLPGGPAADLDLVFSAQVAGWIEPCG